jgi:UMF1 family MFS transporter
LVSLVIVAGLIVADPDVGKTLLGLDPIAPVDAATRTDERLVGPFCALWYLIFVLPLFLFTPDRRGTRVTAPVRVGVTHLVVAVKDLYANHREVLRFLIARMVYADGLGAVFAFGGIYAASVFGWGASELGLFGIILTIAGTIRHARRSLRLQAGDRLGALSVHCRLDRRAVCGQDKCAFRS